jgi:hypothetical protein
VVATSIFMAGRWKRRDQARTGELSVVPLRTGVSCSSSGPEYTGHGWQWLCRNASTWYLALVAGSTTRKSLSRFPHLIPTGSSCLSGCSCVPHKRISSLAAGGWLARTNELSDAGLPGLP